MAPAKKKVVPAENPVETPVTKTPPKEYKVYLVAQAPVSVETVRKAGGKVPFELRKQMGGARVEKGSRIIVTNTVADKLLELAHQSYERGREDTYVRTFHLEGKVPENG